MYKRQHYFCEDTQEIETLVDSEISNIMKCAPGAIRKSKELSKKLSGERPEEFLDMTINILADSWESIEGKEGIKAFFEKSKAPWVN